MFGRCVLQRHCFLLISENALIEAMKLFLKIGLLVLLAIVFGWFLFRPTVINKSEETDAGNNISNDEILRQKIGQMLIIGFRGTEAKQESYIAGVLEEIKPGGVILFDYDLPSQSFPRNITSPEQAKNLIAQLKNISTGPIFVSVDAEGGKVNRLKPKYGFEDFPGHAWLGQQNNPAQTKSVSEKLSLELNNLGFNLNFAPVVDLNINPQNPVIGALGRSFSSFPEKVFEQAFAFIAGQHSNNIITAVKHFPGHGSSKSDSHLGMVDVTDTWQEAELIPYQKLVQSGILDMVMTAHIVNRNIDPDYPVTLSENYIKPILRNQIGFKGVVVSDDMQMGAITLNYGLEQAAVRAVKAGCDMLIISNNIGQYDEQAPYKVLEAIFSAVKSGEISESAINESHQRIMELKEKYNL